MPKAKCLLVVLSVIYILYASPAAHPSAPSDHQDLILEYAAAVGLTRQQILDVAITESGMKVVVDQCALCGSFKNKETRNRIARTSLQWLLAKTGKATGSVEWFNRSGLTVMTISGSLERSEISAGPSCAIQ